MHCGFFDMQGDSFESHGHDHEDKDDGCESGAALQDPVGMSSNREQSHSNRGLTFFSLQQHIQLGAELAQSITQARDKAVAEGITTLREEHPIRPCEFS